MSSQTTHPSLYQKAICVSSSKRIEGSPSNFSQRISLPRNNTFTKISLVHASIPKGWYMIDSQIDLLYEDSASVPGVPITIQFPSTNVQRNYTITELCAELVVVLNAAAVTTGSAATYTCTFDSSTSKLTVTASAGIFHVNLSEDTAEGKDLLRYLGWNTTNSSTLTVYVSPNRVNLQRYNKIYLNCSLTSNSDDSILTELYMAGTGNSDVFEYRTPDACMSARGMSGNQNDNIRVSLLDANKRPINLNGLDWDATIVCYDDLAGRPRC